MAFVSISPRWHIPKIQQNFDLITTNNQPHSLPQSPHQKRLKGKLVKGNTLAKNMNQNQQFYSIKQKENKEYIRKQLEQKSLTGTNTGSWTKNRKQLKTTASTFRLSSYERMKNNRMQISGESKIFQISKILIANKIETDSIKLDKKDGKGKTSMNIFSNYELKKTIASIKQSHSDNFYIGSKDSHLLRKRKTVNLGSKSNKYIKQSRSKSNSIGNMSPHRNQKEFQKQQKQALLQMKIQREARRNKPISAKHPFSKKQSSQYPQQSKLSEKQTRIQSEECSEFIQNAIPGPGSYDLFQGQRTTKKCKMFTENNRDRFQNQQTKHKIGYEFLYTQKQIRRNANSRAGQARVGFGKVVPQNRMIIQNKKQQNIQEERLVREINLNSFSIESKCLKMKLKDTLNPGFFLSKAQRFSNQNMGLGLDDKSKYKKKINKENLQYEKQLQSMKNALTSNQNYYFKSVTKSENKDTRLNSNLQYLGQRYKTIQQSVTNIQQKGNENMERDKYDNAEGNSQNDVLKRGKSDIEIKHQLIEGINGYRQRQKTEKSPKEIHAYSFGRNQQIKCKDQIGPSPTQYHQQLSWIKNSFNINFMAAPSAEQIGPQHNTPNKDYLLIKQIRQ